MISKGPVIINDAFAVEFELGDAWNKYRKENDIENPWIKYRKIALEAMKREKTTINIGGAEIPCEKVEFDSDVRMTPTDEERVSYRRQEYLWKGAKILPQVTWDEFERWVECREGITCADFRPCDSRDGVCTFTCALFGEKCPFGK